MAEKHGKASHSLTLYLDVRFLSTRGSMNPKFRVGQIIQHRKYDYLGLIVSVDSHCRADEDWYQNNRSQPERNQPWYHVLVHESDHATYVAEENLEIDSSGLEEIEHASQQSDPRHERLIPLPGDPRLN